MMHIHVHVDGLGKNCILPDEENEDEMKKKYISPCVFMVIYTVNQVHTCRTNLPCIWWSWVLIVVTVHKPNLRFV